MVSGLSPSATGYSVLFLLAKTLHAVDPRPCGGEFTWRVAVAPRARLIPVCSGPLRTCVRPCTSAPRSIPVVAGVGPVRGSASSSASSSGTAPLARGCAWFSRHGRSLSSRGIRIDNEAASWLLWFIPLGAG